MKWKDTGIYVQTFGDFEVVINHEKVSFAREKSKEMLNALEAAGAGNILRRGVNSYAVDVDTYNCDLYEYEKENATPEALNRFRGEY